MSLPDAEILRALSPLTEDQLRIVIVNLGLRLGFVSYELHGTGEHGIDVVWICRSSDDMMNKHVVYVFQAKAGRVDLARFRGEVLGQYAQMRARPIPQANRNSARRFFFLASELSPEVWDSVTEQNEVNDIPIEVWLYAELALLIGKKGYSVLELLQPISRAIQA